MSVQTAEFDAGGVGGYTPNMEALEVASEELILSFLAEAGEDYTSGEALSDKLGLSRTAVWKHVEVLRRMGYEIEASRSKGYRLLAIPDRLTSLELGPLLSTREFARNVHTFDELPSTNTKAFELAQQGAEHGDVVIAESQTAGRGRRGREWVSIPNKNLYCSVILKPDLPPQRAPELTLVAAVAVAETLRDAGVQAEIKWPNDLHIDGRKVGGILTELSAETDRIHFVILGIGLNLNANVEDFPNDLQHVATSVAIERHHSVPRALFAAALFKNLENWVDRHEEQGFAPVRERWKQLSSMLGHEVLVKTERLEVRGVAYDIDETGALMLRREDQTIERIIAGDVVQVRSKKII